MNVVARQFKSDLPRLVERALVEARIGPEWLTLEMVESTLMDGSDETIAILDELRHQGVALAIDDFGTGYSSLSYLHRFPIDILKIDRSFVSRLTEAGDGPELARAVVTLGDTLGLETVAEGIEHEAQVAELIELGCVAGQGFLFAAPGSLDVVSATPYATRRAELRRVHAAHDRLTATGRFRIEDLRSTRSVA